MSLREAIAGGFRETPGFIPIPQNRFRLRLMELRMSRLSKFKARNTSLQIARGFCLVDSDPPPTFLSKTRKENAPELPVLKVAVVLSGSPDKLAQERLPAKTTPLNSRSCLVFPGNQCVRGDIDRTLVLAFAFVGRKPWFHHTQKQSFAVVV